MNERSEPIIGICAVKERARWAFWDQEAHLVADSYVSGLQRAGAIAILLPVDRRAPLALIDGLVLIGGADIDPRSYGAVADPAVESTYPDRDQFELALLRGAIDRELPVLAICRGMQLLNVALGGSLNQDLSDSDGSQPHRRIVGSFDGNEHTIELEPGSLAARAAGETIHVGRCHHHQAVWTVAEGLEVSGRTADGVIEAIELRDGGWVLGVQWHPEADESSRLFAALRDAAAEHARCKTTKESPGEPLHR
jgi:putative glutamine amidotransferase